MANFSTNLSYMDLKNFSFSDQLSSPRKKVISRFGLGVVLSFIVLSVVLFNVSFKAPFFPVFQGFNSVGSRSNSSFLSWPFSSSSVHNDTSVVQNLRHPGTINGAIGSSKSSNISKSELENMGFENAHMGNVSEKLKDGSFSEGGGVEVKGDEKNGSLVDKNAVFLGASAKGNKFGGSVESVKNESVGVKENGGDGNVEGRNFKVSGDGRRSYKDCDLYDGRWVRDDTKPYYPPGSCPYIDKDFDCHLNGRPDNEFVKWKWQPLGCDIPSFNTTDFLERLEGKKLVFVGDSLNRNMWESLVCVLRHGVRDKKQVYEISGRHEFKKKGFYAIRFEDYNCSVDFVSSPFLVKESTSTGKNGSFETLRLDLMDGTTSMYYDADVIIFNTGHWWTHEKTARGENYYQEGNYIHPKLKVLEAFKRALKTWASWVDKNIDASKTRVIFRGYSETHFRGGPWNLGGQCNKETEPIFNDTHLAKYPSKMRVLEYVLKDMKTPVTYLNISRLTDYRKDGHPSVYRPDYQQALSSVHAQDCSHWCLPGVPDTWNELLYLSLLKSG